MSPVAKFPSMPADAFKRLLRKELGFEPEPDSGGGSHEWLVSEEHGRLRWAFHRREISSIEVRNVLVKQIGLTVAEALKVVGK